MIKGKKILVTSGGVQEFIDNVHVLTTVDSGKHGAIIAQKLIELGISGKNESPEVFYLQAHNTYLPDILEQNLKEVIEVRTARNAYNAMQKLVPGMDAVVYCMTVPDFTFRQDEAINRKTGDPQAFIDYMRHTITTNPKIIAEVKKWNPKAVLVDFKFEVGLSTAGLIALADASIENNGCDLIVASDKEIEDKEYVAHFVFAPKWKNMDFICKTVMGKEKTAEEIVYFLNAVLT